MAVTKKSFPPGIHAPSFTFFGADKRQSIDWKTQDKHLSYLIKSGLQGVFIAGTCGESAALTVDEVKQLIKRARELAVELGRPELPITAGCLGNCTRDVIDRIQVVHESGANFALVLPPAAFAFAMNQKALVEFYREVADNSPIPVVIYNFPSVVNGQDLSSETLVPLGRHENICAVKLTCGGIAKVATSIAHSPPSSFASLSGQGDWLLPALTLGAQGCVAGVANLFPKALMKVQQLYNSGDIEAATALQIKASKMEMGFAEGGLNGSKWIIAKMLGYPEASGHCRRPIPAFTDEFKIKYISKSVNEFWPVEKELEKEG